MRSRYGDQWLGFEPKDIESMLSDAGFRIEEQRQYPVRKGLKVLLYRSRREERTGDQTGEGLMRQQSAAALANGDEIINDRIWKGAEK
jgi:hypothetical protein